MRKIFWGAFTLILCICFFACRKTNDGELHVNNNPASEKEIAAIKGWLATQKPSSDAVSFDEMVNSLDWELSDKSGFKESQLITIPISKPVTVNKVSKYLPPTTDISRNYLNVVLTQSGEIQFGNIVQLTPTEPIATAQPSRLIGNIFSNTSSQYNGLVTVMSVNQNFIYQLRYADNQRKSELSFKTLPKGQKAEITPEGHATQKTLSKFAEYEKKLLTDVVCWDWYLFEFWSDGTVTATYLYSECGPATPPCAEAGITPKGEIITVRVLCTDNSSGGTPLNLEDLCSSTPTQARTVLNSVSYSALNNVTYTNGEQYAAPTENNPFAIERPRLPRWEFERVTLLSVKSLDFAAIWSGVVVKNNPNLEGDPWRWKSLSFGNIFRSAGSMPSCMSATWTATGAAAFSTNLLEAFVSMSYQYTFYVTCPVTTEYKTSGIKTKDRKFVAE